MNTGMRYTFGKRNAILNTIFEFHNPSDVPQTELEFINNYTNRDIVNPVTTLNIVSYRTKSDFVEFFSKGYISASTGSHKNLLLPIKGVLTDSISSHFSSSNSLQNTKIDYFIAFKGNIGQYFFGDTDLKNVWLENIQSIDNARPFNNTHCRNYRFTNLQANGTAIRSQLFHDILGNRDGNTRVILPKYIFTLETEYYAKGAFSSGSSNSYFYLHKDMETINNGEEDAGIVYGRNTYGINIIYIQNEIKPSKVNDLTGSFNSQTNEITINFSEPSSYNLIDHYELFIDDMKSPITAFFYNREIFTTNYSFQVEPNKTYNIWVRAFDIYGNVSETNITPSFENRRFGLQSGKILTIQT